MISLFHRVENTVEKGENAGYQHFLLYPQCFPEPSSGLFSGLCGKGLKSKQLGFLLPENSFENISFWFIVQKAFRRVPQK